MPICVAQVRVDYEELVAVQNRCAFGWRVEGKFRVDDEGSFAWCAPIVVPGGGVRRLQVELALIVANLESAQLLPGTPASRLLLQVIPMQLKTLHERPGMVMYPSWWIHHLLHLVKNPLVSSLTMGTKTQSFRCWMCVCRISGSNGSPPARRNDQKRAKTGGMAGPTLSTLAG